MKTEGKVRQKLKQVFFRHRKVFIQEHLKQCPENCKFNQAVKVENKVYGFCTHPNRKTPITLCDSSQESLNASLTCGEMFEASKDAESLKERFIQEYENNENLGEVAVEYPDVAALRWVLSEDDYNE